MHISTIILLASAPLLSLASPIGFDINIGERAEEVGNTTASPEICCVPAANYCGTPNCKRVNSK